MIPKGAFERDITLKDLEEEFWESILEEEEKDKESTPKEDNRETDPEIIIKSVCSCYLALLESEIEEEVAMELTAGLLNQEEGHVRRVLRDQVLNGTMEIKPELKRWPPQKKRKSSKNR